MNKVCVICGDTFTTGYSFKKKCNSINCHKIAEKLINKRRYIKNYKSKRKEKNCIICGCLYFGVIHQKVCSNNLCLKQHKKNVVKIFVNNNKEKNRLKFKNLSYFERRKRYEKQYISLKKRYQTNINLKILGILRIRLFQTLKNNKKLDKTINLLGCSIHQLKEHLEKQFKSGMSWNNYGLYSWHIDHIIPCSSFDLRLKEQQQKCFHYTNLQPLWAKDNLIKSDKIMVTT